MVKKRLIVVAYDISNNKRRKRLAKLLESHGARVNYSVFECFLLPAELEGLKQAAQEIIKPKHDCILYYELCGLCTEKIDRYGNHGLARETVKMI